HPAPRLSHGAVRTERHPYRQRLQRLLEPRQRARRRDQRRQARLAGVRDPVRYQAGRRVLRAPQGQESRAGESLQHRHHLHADSKGAVDQVVIFSMGYGSAATADGRWFPWVFTFPTTYWSQASAVIRYMGQQEGGLEKLKGKKIVHIYHN